MSVITAIPWHVYVAMFLFSVTMGILVAIALQDVWSDASIVVQLRRSRPFRARRAA